jgi:ribosome-associated protein
MSKTARPARTRTISSSSRSKKAGSSTAPRKPAAAASPKRRTSKPAGSASRIPADVKLAVSAAQDKQALDLRVLDLRNDTAFTDFFIVCTGANTKQVQAIADNIEAALRTAGQKPALVEGYQRAEWILLDYFTFIVHIFLPNRRTFYDLERLWGGAESIEVPAT